MLELREQLKQEKQRHHAMRERLDIQEQTSISKEQMHQQVTFFYAESRGRAVLEYFMVPH